MTIRALLVTVLLAAMTFAAQAERRVALVFSADHYRTLRPLRNADNDGLAVKGALEALGFEVSLEQDRDLRRMRRALDDFREDAKGADAVLVYYSGHGVEIAGENRLLPVDADAASVDTLKASSLPLEEVRDAVAATGKVGLVVLDACRNDPFGGADGQGRSVVALGSAMAAKVRPGLGRVGRAENILFAFSAAPGETAADGSARNSPFTAALAKYLGTQGLEIRSVLTLVQQEVYDLSKGRQLPYVESGLPRLFFASTTQETLPERERLLLAMADVTPDIRDQVERIAAARDMPLAPLFGALMSSSASGLSADERGRKLAEAADAFVKVREDMRTLSSSDPRVTTLRRQAQEQLSLGAFDAARAKLVEAAGIDARSRGTLKENYVERTLSEAATHYLSGGAARADLAYTLAIADYEKAAALFGEVDADIPVAERSRQILALQALGDIQVLVGNLAKAGLAYEALSRVSARLAAHYPDDAAWQRDLAISHSNIGDVLVAQGNLSGAMRSYRTSLDIITRLAAADPGNAKLQRDLSTNADEIGNLLVAQGNLRGAQTVYQSSLDNMTRLVAANPGNTAWQRDLAGSHSKVGGIALALGNLPAALAAYQASFEIMARLAAGDPGNIKWQGDLSIAHEKIGDIRLAQKDLPGALDAYRDKLRVVLRLVASDPGSTAWQRDMLVGRNKIGNVLFEEGDLPGALEHYRAALDMATRLALADPTNAGWQHDLAISYEKVGDVLLVQNDLSGALEAYRQRFAIVTRLAAGDSSNADWQRDLIISHFKLAQAGDHKRDHLSQALEIAEQMERTGRLAPPDKFIPQLLRQQLSALR